MHARTHTHTHTHRTPEAHPEKFLVVGSPSHELTLTQDATLQYRQDIEQ